MSGFNAHEYIAGKMFVGGLSSRTTEGELTNNSDSLRKYFEEFGQIFDCVLMMDKQTGRSRGFGFVTMVDPAIADEITAKKPHIIDHRQVDIKRAIPKGEDSQTDNPIPRGQSSKPAQPLFQPYQQTRSQNEMTLAQLTRRNQEAQRVFTNQKQPRRPETISVTSTSPVQGPEVHNSAKIFVGGLTQDTNERDLRKYFEQFGETVDTVVMYERGNNRSRGFGFVTFASSTVAKYVLEWKKGHNINGRRVDCKKATPKEEGSSEAPRYAPDSTINLYKADPSSSSEIYEQAARAFVDNFMTRQVPSEPRYPMPVPPRLPSAVPLAQILGTSIFRQPELQTGGEPRQIQRERQPTDKGYQYIQEKRPMQLGRGPPISDSMTTELIIQAYEKMLGKQVGYGYQKEEIKERPEFNQAEQTDDRVTKRVAGQSVPLDPKYLLAALMSKSEPFSPPTQQPKWGGTPPMYPYHSRYIPSKEKQPVNIYDFSNPNENLQQMIIPDDSWGPMKGQRQLDHLETKNQNGESMLNRAEDRLNKKPY